MELQTSTLSHRKVLREDIRIAIREAIFAGTLKPGDRIIETFWAKELDVSQGPVREAIRDLEALGLVETIPFKGSRVRWMTKKDMRDNYSVRVCLEAKSVQDIIGMLSDEELEDLTAHLYKTLKEMDEYAKNGDLHNFSNCDTVFHRRIIEATNNQVLSRLWEQCNVRTWYIFSSLTDSESLEQIQHSHKQIVDAICARDVREAICTIEGHLTALMDGLMQE